MGIEPETSGTGPFVPTGSGEGPWIAAPPRHRPHRRWVHALLFVVTAGAVTFAGSLWEGAYAEAASVLSLLGMVFSDPAPLLRGVPFATCLLAILGSHEMGHYLACRHHGIPASLPFFLPGPPPFGTFGAVIRIRGIIPDRNALFDVAAAGPIAGFSVAFPVLVVGLLRATPLPVPLTEGGLELGSPLLSTGIEHLLHGGGDLGVDSIYLAGWFGMLVTSMNLFPVGQLDGGHAAYACSARLHRAMSRLTLAGVVALVVFQTLAYRTLSAYAVWCAVLLFMRDRHPRLADEYAPLHPARRALACVLLLLFVLSFIPVPISL